MAAGRAPLAGELAALWRLATPVILAQMALMLMGTVDIAMVGHMPAADGGETALAAVGLGNLFCFCSLILGLGTLAALDPLVSQAWGGGRVAAAGGHLRAGHVVAVLLALPTALLWWFAVPLLSLLEQPPELMATTRTYVRWCIPGIWPMLAFRAQRQGLQASGVTRPIVVVVVLANAFNALANYGLIYELRWGVAGAGLATSLSRTLLGVGLVAATWDADITRAARAARVTPRAIGRVLVIGAPIGLQMGLEIWAFNGAGVIVGWLGARPFAAHTVALNIISLAFMVPLGISTAAAVRVGRAVGARDDDGARRAALVAMVCGAGVMLLSATLFALLPEQLARIYTHDADVVALVALLLPIAALFQLVDGTQVVAFGALRGVGDILWPTLANLCGYYAVALPLGFHLTFEGGWGVRGPWIGLAVGLTLVAIPLCIRLALLMRDPPRPLEEGGDEDGAALGA